MSRLSRLPVRPRCGIVPRLTLCLALLTGLASQCPPLAAAEPAPPVSSLGLLLLEAESLDQPALPAASLPVDCPPAPAEETIYQVSGSLPVCAPEACAPALCADQTQSCEPPAEESSCHALGKCLSCFSLGLDGGAGTGDTFNFTLGYQSLTTRDLTTYLFDLDYFLNLNQGDVSRNRVYTLTRMETLFAEDSSTSWYLQGWNEYDQLQDFQDRIATHAGLGHLLWDEDGTTLKARTGFGTSYAFSGPNRDCLPEAQFGLDFTRPLNDAVSLFVNVDYYPDVTDFSTFRVIAQAGVGVVLDEESGVGVNLSVFNRHATPSGNSSANNLDYVVMITKSL